MAKILLVEDDADLLRLLQFSFGEQGHSMLAASNGAEALSLADQERPDLIILDIIMPLMDGFETLRLLRRNPPTSNIPVIVITAKDDTEDIAKGWALGADFYLTKPFQLAELLSVANSLLAKEQAPEETQESAPEI